MPERATRLRSWACGHRFAGGHLAAGVMLVMLLAARGVANPEIAPGFDARALGRPVQLDAIGSGELLCRTPDGLVPLPRGETDVHLEVTGIMTHGTLVQRFYNPTPEVIDVVYVFPLPERAAVHSMEMQIGERRIVSVIQEREEARRTYQRARRQGRKAALVEQERPNLFTTSAANIAPGERIALRLEYYQELDWQSGEYQLSFPLTFTPRFVPLALERPPAAVSDAAPDRGQRPAPAPRLSVPDAARILPPFLPSADDRGMWVTLCIDLDPGFPLERIESRSHRVRLEREGLRWTITPQAGRLRADRDFLLRWRPQTSPEAQMRVFTEERAGECYALMMLLPPKTEAGIGLPVETLFVIDVSGSMQGPSIAQAREALIAALDRLRPGDAFNLLKFSNLHELFHSTFQEASDAQALEAARRWVRRLEADGGTMILPALLRATDACDASRGERLRRIVLLTDAAVGNEDEVLQQLQLRLGATRLYTVGIGRAPNRHLMERMAEIGRGSCTFVATRAEAENRIDAFLSRIARPLITQAELRWHGVGVQEVYPDPLPDLHAGDPLCVSLKLGEMATAAAVELVARSAAGPVALHAPLVPDAPHEAGVAVRWARANVRDLMGGLHRGISREAVRASVVPIAHAFHLVTAFTSLVAVEEAPSVATPGRTAQMPNRLPDGSHLLGAPQGGTKGPLHLWLGLLLGACGLALWVAARTGRSA
ncbi:MAG: marine proteobacterial sortase target protein [Candidatus Eisenbacteria bacterium]|nr:marine proteobacterial sortase target protein [Candidatus Eisenbacteria bacterium]